MRRTVHVTVTWEVTVTSKSLITCLLHLPYRPSLDISPVALRFELEARPVFVRPAEAVDLRVVVLDGLPQAADGLLEIGVIVRLPLEDHHLARRQLDQFQALRDGAGIMQGHFHPLGVDGGAGLA